jgi:putative AlgH/UPF0301 family transcriptional regulator
MRIGSRGCDSEAPRPVYYSPATFLVAFGYAGWGRDQVEHEIQVCARAIAEVDPALSCDRSGHDAQG